MLAAVRPPPFRRGRPACRRGGARLGRPPGLHGRRAADAAVRGRVIVCGAALLSSGLPWPRQRVTVNLAPGGLRKTGAGLELPIAVGVLVASEALPTRRSWTAPGSSVSWGSTVAAGRPRRGVAGGCHGRDRSGGPGRTSAGEASWWRRRRVRSGVDRGRHGRRLARCGAVAIGVATRPTAPRRGPNWPTCGARWSVAPRPRDRRRRRAPPPPGGSAGVGQDDARHPTAGDPAHRSTATRSLEVLRIHSAAGVRWPAGGPDPTAAACAPHGATSGPGRRGHGGLRPRRNLAGPRRGAVPRRARRVPRHRPRRAAPASGGARHAGPPGAIQRPICPLASCWWRP